MLELLHKDRTYRRFRWAQFWLGAPVMAAEPAFIIAMDEHFQLDYRQSIALTQVIPIFLTVLTIPLWARLLDRVHIVHFRAYHSWVFVVAVMMMGAGFLTESLAVIYVSRVILGVANGGGVLAWQLGHHDFARDGDNALYMGVHVTLTGVRGAFAPFLGVLLYSGLHAAGGRAPLDVPGIGAWCFLVCAALGAYGAWMFVSMHRSIRGQGPGRARAR
jgi:hypothetical protein